ncbi:hypothetical protein JCGZ_25670 [Jatropha curcas]|uniref:Uncharacterized protein n=1 Tax=Jatropha curcas TaxID=180498 RepID=A0A067JXV2_JATCU|nr:hypothetical protein JCGZ_25670 [Jatropha curcas]
MIGLPASSNSRDSSESGEIHKSGFGSDVNVLGDGTIGIIDKPQPKKGYPYKPYPPKKKPPPKKKKKPPM